MPQCGSYGNGLPLSVANCGLYPVSGTNVDDGTGQEVHFVGKFGFGILMQMT